MGTVGSTGADVSLSDNATTRAIVWLTSWDSQGTHRTATATITSTRFDPSRRASETLPEIGHSPRARNLLRSQLPPHVSDAPD
jgi:hypothetical protein